MTTKIVPILLLLMFVVSAPATGYTQTCFNAKPLPDCKRFFLTEFTYGNQANGSIDRGHLFSPEFGLMVNLGKKHAVGGSCFLDVMAKSDFGGRYRLGLKSRYRFWINSTFCLDGGVGAAVSDQPIVLAEASFVYKAWIGIGGRAEHWFESGYHEQGDAFYGTLRLGGWPGLSLTPVFAVILAVIWVSYIAAG